jgi:uncharacterized protein (DUF488 family)
MHNTPQQIIDVPGIGRVRRDISRKNDMAFYTIGHSTRDVNDFIALLAENRIELVVDVRSVPKSGRHPYFNQRNIFLALEASKISYLYLAHLGGFRKKFATIPRETNGFWENDSFHNYADYALTEQFRDGLSTLLDKGHKQRCAVMCSEAVWWRCHRRIITDHLIAAGESVFHIMRPGCLETARLTPAAVVSPEGLVTYPFPLTQHNVDTSANFLPHNNNYVNFSSGQ